MRLRTNSHYLRSLAIIVAVFTLILSACTSSQAPPSPTPAPTSTPTLTTTTTPTPAPTPASTPTPSSAPSISIVQPGTNTYVVGTDNVSVVVQVSGFALVDKIGQANMPGEGHIIYYLDVQPPTTPGQPAVTAPGTYAASAASSYVWTELVQGVYTFSVELVNNDNTPLVPPVVSSITITVYPG